MAKRTKIMIVDDNPIDHMITKYILKHNFEVEDVMVMECAEAALLYLEQKSQHLTELPELIILDLDMPGLNGFDFLEKFATFNERLITSCKIVVLTGSDVSLDLAKIKSNKYVSELISKPLNKDSLITII